VAQFPASRALGVNADGTVVVGFSGTEFAMEAFRWTAADGMKALPRLGAANLTNIAWATSADGSVVVGQSNPSARQAFRWTAATGTRPLGLDPSFNDSAAYGVSADGAYAVGVRSAPLGAREAVIWNPDGSVTRIPGVGPGDLNATGLAISADASTVVGEAAMDVEPDDSTAVAFRWTRTGGTQALGDLDGSGLFSIAHAVSGDGSTVVGLGRSAGGDEAFIWTPAGMMSLKDLLTFGGKLDLTGWTLSDATGVSADGKTIVGFGINTQGQTEAWVAVVPEPVGVWVLGVAALCLMRRVNRAASAPGPELARGR
jgi:uncharacterized membrane protein